MKVNYYLSFLLICISLHAFAQEKLQVGDKAPDFTVTDPQGNKRSLSDLRGKLVMVDFWASWCMPCRMANPGFVEVYDEYSESGFEIFSVSLDVKKEAWKKAIENDNLYWENHGSDLKGWENETALLYGVDVIPTTFLIDEKGYIIARDLDDIDLKKKLKYLFHKKVYMYPKMANTKLYFTNKTRFSIVDSTGNVVVKEKGTEVDITELPEGIYTCEYEDRIDTITKRTSHLPKVSFFPSNVADTITLSREADYEVINQRGLIQRKGKGKVVDIGSLGTGVYYLNLEGDIQKVFKK